MSRKISLQEAIEFCQMRSDEESDFDENVSEDEADDSELHENLYREPNDKLLENEDGALTSEKEQSDDDDDMEAGEPVAIRQFHRQYKKYTVSSIAISLDKVKYDVIDFDNVEAKEVDIPLEKKDRLSQKIKLGHHKTQAKLPSRSTNYYTEQTRCQTRILWYR